MKFRRLGVPVAVLFLTLGLAAAPAAAAAPADKPAVMSSWSQPTATSFSAWNAARRNQGAWAAYGFDWSTDSCSTSPDQPLGFDFRLPCQRHDFGYRNYKAIGRFPANKGRVDDSFYHDLKARCAAYNRFVRPACTSLAWTYYQAVVAFGDVVLSDAQLQRAADLKERGELAAVKAARGDR
ncbi:phospholipase [Dactylosporangium roseum]|uniref:Phospholipase n=1 Tax=Dactylosporangium roseum TaxID=47989 RepID=A0ABY5Z0Z4_9ACTN|nr:phospholipase [Dactylosporangium roseum]UWZ35329.1 phospholipase [Dactylosporangium roseum]